MYRYNISVVIQGDSASVQLMDQESQTRMSFQVPRHEAGPLAYALHAVLRNTQLHLNPEIEYW
jgi:hypothetical protein